MICHIPLVIAFALATTVYSTAQLKDSKEVCEVPDPLDAVRLALVLRLEDDALRKIKKLPPPHTPDQEVQRALLQTSALVSRYRLHEALTALQQTIDNLTENEPDAALLHYMKALILAKREDFPGAQAALTHSLARLPEDHPIYTHLLATRLLLPLDGESRSQSQTNAELLRLHNSLPPGRGRDVLMLALLSQTAHGKASLLNYEKMAQKLTAHPDPIIAVTARFLILPQQVSRENLEQISQQLDTLIKEASAPLFIRAQSAIRRAQIHLQQKEFDPARAIAELAMTSAQTPSQHATALHLWWQTYSPDDEALPSSAQKLISKITSSLSPEIAADVAANMAKKFSSLERLEISASLLLYAAALHPDINQRQNFLDAAASQALNSDNSRLLRQWLENPAHSELLPARAQFWRGFLALRENNIARAQECFSALLLPNDPQARSLGQLGHAAVTLSEDPEAPLDEILLQDFPPQQHQALLLWLQTIRLLYAAARGLEHIALKTSQEILSSTTQEAISTIISGAKNALDHGHATLSLKILNTTPLHLRGQKWKIQSLLARISDGQIAPNEEPQAWKDLLTRLTLPDLITQARERLAAACWNITNYTCALSEWTKLLAGTTLTPQRRAEITYFAALAARRSGDTTKAAELIGAVADTTNSPDPSLSCEALLELARLGLENTADTQKPLEQLEKITTLSACWPDTAATAALLIAEHLLQETSTDIAQKLGKITSLLSPLAANTKISKDLAFRAKIITGLAFLRAGQDEPAEEAFLDVVYGRLAAGAANSSRPAEMYWFARAVLEAGILLEKRQAWTQATALYRLAENTIPPESESWRNRRLRIEREHMIFE